MRARIVATCYDHDAASLDSINVWSVELPWSSKHCRVCQHHSNTPGFTLLLPEFQQRAPLESIRGSRPGRLLQRVPVERLAVSVSFFHLSPCIGLDQRCGTGKLGLLQRSTLPRSELQLSLQQRGALQEPAASLRPSNRPSESPLTTREEKIPAFVVRASLSASCTSTSG